MKNKINKSLTSPLFYLCTLVLTGCNATGSSRMLEQEQEDLPSSSNPFPNRICANANIREVLDQIKEIVGKINNDHPNTIDDVNRIIDTADHAILNFLNLYEVIWRIQNGAFKEENYCSTSANAPCNIINNAANQIIISTCTALNAVHTAVKSACQADINIASNDDIVDKIYSVTLAAKTVIRRTASVIDLGYPDRKKSGIMLDTNFTIDETVRATNATIKEIRDLI